LRDSRLDLEDMDIINVSSEEEKNGEIQLRQIPQDRADLPLWDYLPDEVCLRIFSFLTEEKAIQMAGVCKRFAILTNEEAFWEEKAKGWIHTKVDKPNGPTGELRNHYVRLYKQNQDEEKRKQGEADKQKKNRKWEKKKARIKDFFTCYWSIGAMEVPTVFCVLLFTIFVALRLDEVIIWDYHLVFLPLYIAMANILCGLCTTDGVYYYLKWKRLPNTYTYDSFSTKSTATLVYEELTPITDYIRGKGSTFVWWATVLTSFVLLAQALNYQGIFLTGWCLVSLLVGLVLLMCIYLSWFPRSDFCSGDKFKGGIVIFGNFLYISWMVLFFYFKSGFVADFSWWVTFTPWWVIGIFSFGALLVSWAAFIDNRSSSDFWLFAGLITTATVAFMTIVAFLILLAYNLEAIDSDLPAFPWIIVITPIIIFEVFGFFSCCAMALYITFK